MKHLDTITGRHEADVVVAGGGPAGVAAAIAAARAGARVALIEGTGCFGGMATSGLVPTFNPFSNGKRPVIKGIGWEVVTRLRKRGSALMKEDPLPREIPKYDWVRLDAEKLKLVLDDMVREAGVRTRLFTQATEPVVKGGRITAVRTWSKSGQEEWRAPVFVDATGDADIAARAGCPYEKGDENGVMQSTTLCFVIAGLEPAAGRLLDSRARGALLQKATEEGKLSGRYDHHYCITATQADYRTVGLNYKHQIDTDATNAASLTAAAMEGRRMAHELCEFLRKEIKGCEGAFVATTAQLLGVRETRRIVGEYRLDVEHFLALRRSADDIADYANELDVHVSGKSKADIAKRMFKEHNTYLPVGRHYGIPYGALIPKGVTNLLVAGRAISCDRKMLGSVRVMPACFATGQAAGLAARLAGRGDGRVRGVDIRKLQQCLIRQGAYLDLPARKGPR
jgi:hypothetical protein